MDRGLVREIGRRPGQKEDRWQHMLGGDVPLEQGALRPTRRDRRGLSRGDRGRPDDEVGRAGTGAGRIAAVEAEVRVLRDEIGALRSRLEALERDAG